MCGILGGWLIDRSPAFEENISLSMLALRHRGPDDQAYEWLPTSTPGHVFMGHTRLSILDLSFAGHQPMHTTDGRYCLVFNGEIYNYPVIRSELQQLGCVFQSESDTEVLLLAWQAWGLSCLHRLEGMFALVVYDKAYQTLTCIRDPFGIKPFFYTHKAGYFLFASEQPAILALRGGNIAVDWQRAYQYLTYADYDNQARTFIDGVHHLLPGHCMVFDLATGKLRAPTPWWTPKTRETPDMSFTQATEALREQFLTNITLHLRSDVPLGAALSGGIDSSAIVCAMRYLEPDYPIETFSYIADDAQLSEAHWVNRINQHVGARGHSIVASRFELASELDDMIIAQGEPFGSTSIYAQYCVFKHVKAAGITVVLDGQGADELLAGYYGYPGERLLSFIEQGQWLKAARFLHQWSRWPGRSYQQGLMHLGRLCLPNRIYAEAGKWVGRHASPKWLNTNKLLEHGVHLADQRMLLQNDGRERRVIERLASSLQYRGLQAMLRHADRNSMRFSVESRVPFLTVPMADLLLTLPENFLISDTGETKRVFRAAMRGIVPDDVLDRRDKIGFSTPEKDWLMGMAPQVRDWLKHSADIPFLNANAMLGQFDSVVSGHAPFTWQIWRWVNYVRWHQRVVLKNNS